MESPYPTSEQSIATEMDKSARDRIRRTLLKRISEGVYRPGERLIEMKLAQEFEVSQAPVREVFRELETLGVVVSRRYRGTPRQGDHQPGEPGYLPTAWISGRDRGPTHSSGEVEGSNSVH